MAQTGGYRREPFSVYATNPESCHAPGTEAQASYAQGSIPRSAWASSVFLLASLVMAVLAGSETHAQTPDPINGGVTFLGSATCPVGGVGNSICYSANIQCSGIDGSGVAGVPVTLKVTNPASAKGVILFIAPGGGNSWFDQGFAYGSLIVNSLVQAGFTAVQAEFGGSAGWLTGPAQNGMRSLACRYAALATWLYTSTTPLIHQGNTAMCSAGISGGSSVVVFALTHFGMGTGSTRIFDMVEIISGPTFGRLDHGCICNQPPMQTTTGQGLLSDCYVTIGSLVDNTYSTAVCSAARKTHDTSNATLLYHDSIISDDAPFLNYTTNVHVLYGGQNDEGAAVPQGLDWLNSVTSPITVVTIQDAAHLIPDTLDGALQITNDLKNSCLLQP